MMVVNKRVAGLIVNESAFQENEKTEWFVTFLQRYKFKVSQGLLIIPTNIRFEYKETDPNAAFVYLAQNIISTLGYQYDNLMIKLSEKLENIK